MITRMARKALSLIRPRGPLVLMYHRVADDDVDPWQLCVTPERFRTQLAILRRRRRCLALGEFIERAGNGTLPHNAVAVTFDDGYADNLHCAQPLLAQFDVPATIFVTSGAIGADREFWWDELEYRLLRPGELPETLTLELGGRERTWSLGSWAAYTPRQAAAHRRWHAWEPSPTPRHALYHEIWQYLQPLPAAEQRRVLDALASWGGVAVTKRDTHRALTAEELKRFAALDQIEIGAHTVTHPVLPALSESDQANEIRCSREECEALCGHPVRLFSYPHGQSTPVTRTLVKEAGFAGACSTQGRPIHSDFDSFDVPRTAVADVNGLMFVRTVIGGL